MRGADPAAPGLRGSVCSGFGTRLCRGFHSNLHLHLASGHSYNSLRTQAEPERQACGVVGAAVAEAAGAGAGPARRGGGAGAGAGWGAGAEARGWGSPTRPTALGNKIPARHDPEGQFGGPRSGRVVKGNANRTPGHFGHSWGPLSTSMLCEELLLDLDSFGLSCLQSLDQKFHEGIF